MIYYIHGYRSGPDSRKGRLFRKALNACCIRYRYGRPEDIVVSDCLERIYHAIKGDRDVVLIGSSFGGFLAVSTAFRCSSVKKLFLLNPVVIPLSVDIDGYCGIPKRILKDMVDRKFFEEKLDAEVFILRGVDDAVVPSSWVLSFAMAQEAVVYFLHDDHVFTKNLGKLPDIISKFI